MRLMRARMMRGTAAVMCVTSPVSSERGFAPPPGGCLPQPDHRHKLLMPGAGWAAPPGRWHTQNWWIWPSITDITFHDWKFMRY